jgi:hypothetical protein
MSGRSPKKEKQQPAVDIHMRDYRRQAVERIVSRCVNQHGILLAHTFGTGKTYTIGVMLKNFPLSWKKILLAPTDLHQQWRNLDNTLGLNLVIWDIYEPLPAVQNPEILVVDEAHLLIPRVNVELVRRFDAVKKLVLATGTPFIEDAASLHVLLNLAAGKIVLPRDPDQFTRKYMHVSKASAVVYGWLLPIGEKFFRGIFIGRFGIFSALAFLLTITIQIELNNKDKIKAERKEVEEAIEAVKNGKMPKFSRYQSKSTDELREILDKELTYENVIKEEVDDQVKKFDNLIAITEQQLTQTPISVKEKAELISRKTQLQFIKSFYKNIYANANAITRNAVIYMLTSMLWKLAYLQTSEARRDLRKLDVQKLSKDSSPYLLIFDPFQTNDKEILKHFPTPEDRVEHTTLSSYQLLQLQRMAKNKLDYDLLKTMQFVTNPDDMAAYVQRLADQQKQMENLGRMASNLAPADKVPAKFARIFNMHTKKKVATVVYSNFQSGADLFKEAVEKHTTFSAEFYSDRSQLQKSLDGEIDFLILPPKSTQGVDLPGVLRMHILEPLLDAATFAQLRARIIRYVHDAKKSQKVEIIQWVAKLPVGSLMSIPAVSAIFEYWSKYEKMVMPTETFANVILTSPDQIVYARLQKILAEFHEVETLLLRASKNSQFPDPKCSLWEPNGQADPSRMPSCEEFWGARDGKAQVAGRTKSRKSKKSKTR